MDETLRFTGWKKMPGHDSYVAQIVLFTDKIAGKYRGMHYVNIPNMAVGTIVNGSPFDIFARNGKVVTINTPENERLTLISEGWHRLVDHVFSNSQGDKWQESLKAQPEAVDLGESATYPPPPNPDEELKSISDILVQLGLAIHPSEPEAFNV